MGPSRRSPLRRLAHWALRPADPLFVAALMALVVLVLSLAAFGVSHACDNAPPPILHSEAGTPRDRYCSAVQGVGVSWVCVVAPLLLLALAIALLRRATVPSVVVALAVCTAAVTNAAIVGDLRAIQLVPGINA